MKRTLLFILLVVGCKKNDSPDINSKGYFMSAIINGQPWKVTNFGQAYFGPQYNHSKNSFYINIGSDDQSPNTICRSIAIEFDFVPKMGKYYFNNIAPSQIDSGIIAEYTYNNVNHYSTKWSNGGYVEIESITKDDIKGSFNFTAKGDITDSTTTTITLGSFYVVNVGGGDMPWPGP
jgi:hypothetical protein